MSFEISERQEAILEAIIEEYAEVATPVGSVTLAKLFGVSPATVRAEMARLEDMGLIIQPYTSAGRIPTDAGYRFYVNRLTDRQTEPAFFQEENSTKWAEEAENFADDAENNSENVEEIGGEQPENSSAKITENGAKTVENCARNDQNQPENGKNNGKNAEKMQKVGKNADSALSRNTHVLTVRIRSQHRADLAIRTAVDVLAEVTGNLGLATIGEQLYLAGMSRLFAQPEFADPAQVRGVAELLDNLEPWLREAAPGEALNIFIGRENPIGKASGVSLIISKFRSPFSDRSYIGVLGPTRQNYGRVMTLVARAGEMLERAVG